MGQREPESPAPISTGVIGPEPRIALAGGSVDLYDILTCRGMKEQFSPDKLRSFRIRAGLLIDCRSKPYLTVVD